MALDAEQKNYFLTSLAIELAPKIVPLETDPNAPVVPVTRAGRIKRNINIGHDGGRKQREAAEFIMGMIVAALEDQEGTMDRLTSVVQLLPENNRDICAAIMLRIYDRAEKYQREPLMAHDRVNTDIGQVKAY